MAQDVTIAGASYEDVPSIDVPTTGGGTSSFFDVSDTTATAADVASGKVFYAADGVRSTGTASGGGSGVRVFYGTCATSAATAAKVVVCEEFASADLVAGTVVNVKFTNAQTYNGAPTLNVQSTGAKNVKRVGTTNAARYEWQAGEVLQFVYDGTYWMLTDGCFATTTYYGVTKLSSATNSTSTSLAATASAVKAAYDLADGKQDKLVSGTNIKTINNESLLGSGNITISGGASLPIATASTLGGIKVGSGLSVTSDGTLSASGGGGSSWTDISSLAWVQSTEGAATIRAKTDGFLVVFCAMVSGLGISDYPFTIFTPSGYEPAALSMAPFTVSDYSAGHGPLGYATAATEGAIDVDITESESYNPDNPFTFTLIYPIA